MRFKETTRGNAPTRKKTGRNAVEACYTNRKQQALKERQIVFNKHLLNTRPNISPQHTDNRYF